MTRLHVAFLTPGWRSADESAALPAIEDVIHRLAAEHRVTIVALRHPPRHPWRRDGKVAVRSIGRGTRSGMVARASLLAGGVSSVVGVHRRVPIDVLHALWADEPGTVAVLAGRAIGRPAVVSVLGGELAALPQIGYGAALGRGGRWTTRFALARAQAATAGSRRLLDRVRAHGTEADAHLTPLGVDLATFAPADAVNEGGASMTILFVGSLTPVKDPVSVVRAFARVASAVPHARLSMVGDGPLRPGLERLARVLEIGDRVEFVGRIPRSELVDRYRSAALLAVASLHEAQSMVACEAAACGTPVVGTSVGVLPELAEAGGGLTVEVGDVAGLAGAIESAMRDPAARTRMGSAARAFAERTWGIDLTVAAWDALYRTVTNADGA